MIDKLIGTLGRTGQDLQNAIRFLKKGNEEYAEIELNRVIRSVRKVRQQLQSRKWSLGRSRLQPKEKQQ